MKKEQVYELKISEDDPISGIESISLVSDPAIEVNWIAFHKEHSKCKYVPDGKDAQILEELFKSGQPEQELLDDGWIIDSINDMDYEEFGLAPTDPNASSSEDTDTERIRYKYSLNPNISQDPIISTTREYCRTLISRNYVWRKSELFGLNPNSDHSDGGFGGEPAIWRGGYNCRHFWYKIKYKKEGKIVNKASININKIVDDAGREITTIPDWNQDQTINGKTIEAVSKGTAAPTTAGNLGLSKQIFVDVEKHIIVGPAMIPNMKIIRMDEFGNPFYVFFTADTIKQIAEKYMKNKYTDNNDANHSGKAVPDVFVMETWIKEFESDKSTEYGFGSLPVGTWFVSMKVNNPDIWIKVKSKELKGFSVSGFFEQDLVQASKEQMFLIELAKLLNGK